MLKLHRYTDKSTGDEMGVCYSGVDGTPAINNPQWNCVEISESQKDHYIKEQQKQLKHKQDQAASARKDKANRIKAKLKDLGISQDDLDAIIN